jgi:hypothetical protein
VLEVLGHILLAHADALAQVARRRRAAAQLVPEGLTNRPRLLGRRPVVGHASGL